MDLLNHLIDIKSKLSQLDTKVDNLAAHISTHLNEDNEYQHQVEADLAELKAGLNKARGAWLVAYALSVVLTVAVAIQRLLP